MIDRKSEKGERKGEHERKIESMGERMKERKRTIALPSRSPRVNSTTMHCRFLKQRNKIIYININILYYI